jgi:hypothetical protein
LRIILKEEKAHFYLDVAMFYRKIQQSAKAKMTVAFLAT